MADDEQRTMTLRVFTHPACSGCSQAVEEAWKTSQAHPDIELRTVKLENEAGLAEARKEGIKSIPTIILSSATGEIERWVGAPESIDLEATLRSALEELAKEKSEMVAETGA